MTTKLQSLRVYLYAAPDIFNRTGVALSVSLQEMRDSTAFVLLDSKDVTFTIEEDLTRDVERRLLLKEREHVTQGMAAELEKIDRKLALLETPR